MFFNSLNGVVFLSVSTVVRFICPRHGTPSLLQAAFTNKGVFTVPARRQWCGCFPSRRLPGRFILFILRPLFVYPLRTAPRPQDSPKEAWAAYKATFKLNNLAKEVRPFCLIAYLPLPRTYVLASRLAPA